MNAFISDWFYLNEASNDDEFSDESGTIGRAPKNAKDSPRSANNLEAS